jgi:hypothetical protein
MDVAFADIFVLSAHKLGYFGKGMLHKMLHIPCGQEKTEVKIEARCQSQSEGRNLDQGRASLEIQ